MLLDNIFVEMKIENDIYPGFDEFQKHVSTTEDTLTCSATSKVSKSFFPK